MGVRTRSSHIIYMLCVCTYICVHVLGEERDGELWTGIREACATFSVGGVVGLIKSLTLSARRLLLISAASSRLVLSPV